MPPPRPPFVKVCCIASLAEAHAAIAAGASALGLVSAMPSGPGVIPEDLIGIIARAVPPPTATFLLTAERRAAAILAQHARCGTSTIQLVDHVDATELRSLRHELPATKLVQVVHVRDEASLDEALAAAPHVDALLLDSGNQTLPVKELGGTGRVHDWTLSRRIRERSPVPVFLAGGLHSGNVAAAIAAVGPFGLDVCTGVRSDGSLDLGKLGAFVAAATAAQRTAAHGPG